jgi:hypothetical protein
MDYDKLLNYAKTEADWLRYYGHHETRMLEKFNDINFYMRIKSIGYAKVVMSIDKRCAMCFITSDKPILESRHDDIFLTSGPRDHSKNIYTPLEYFIGKGENLEELINIIRGC